MKKNIFWVINKEKIYAYVVSVCTIVALFFMSNLMNMNFKETEETSTKIIENNVIENNTANENKETDKNKETNESIKDEETNS